MLYNNCKHVPDWKWHAYKEGIQGRSQDLKGGVSKGQIYEGWTVDMQSTTLSGGFWHVKGQLS